MCVAYGLTKKRSVDYSDHFFFFPIKVVSSNEKLVIIITKDNDAECCVCDP